MPHDHSHHRHEHKPAVAGRVRNDDPLHELNVPAAQQRRLLLALALTAGFMLVEAGGGVLANSLALLTDAGHMLTDVFSLALAYFALRNSARLADARRTYGYQRYQVLAAFVNGLTLIALSVWVLAEAAQRLWQPAPVAGGIMLWIAAAGLGVNLLVYRFLHGAHDNLNTRAAMAHVLGDLLGSVAALAAAGIILWTRWYPADPLLSSLVALLLLKNGICVVRQSAHVLLEGAPEHLDLSGIEDRLLRALPQLVGVHHVHAWSLTPEQPVMTLHAVVREGTDGDAVIEAVNRLLHEHYGIAHVTVQVERAGCPQPEH